MEVRPSSISIRVSQRMSRVVSEPLISWIIQNISESNYKLESLRSHQSCSQVDLRAENSSLDLASFFTEQDGAILVEAVTCLLQACL